MSYACAAARAAVILFWLATSAYAFLTSVPFVYEQFLEPGLVPALVSFAAWHGWLMLGMRAPHRAGGVGPTSAIGGRRWPRAC